jgi:hypothetical protein
VTFLTIKKVDPHLVAHPDLSWVVELDGQVVDRHTFSDQAWWIPELLVDYMTMMGHQAAQELKLAEYGLSFPCQGFTVEFVR